MRKVRTHLTDPSSKRHRDVKSLGMTDGGGVGAIIYTLTERNPQPETLGQRGYRDAISLVMEVEAVVIVEGGGGDDDGGGGGGGGGGGDGDGGGTCVIRRKGTTRNDLTTTTTT
ncbi:hypothetical protein HZH66_007373 [Vespula vulgaris]|uniref:Uncharacterized protein n=1 Tax=Vespula vulgaris TaxID=7454 RepID=A0A834K3C4_VESVU|nr:hypothetical protein HZH66_007373 [Vespula vulgaris]